MLRVIKLDGQDRPVAMCDVCHDRITDGTDGRFYWATDENGKLAEKGRILFTHLRCSSAFEAANHHLDWCHLPLLCLPISFGDNLNIDWEAARTLTDAQVRS